MAAIVIVLLLVLAVGSTAAALVGVFLYRRRLEPKQTASATGYGNILLGALTCLNNLEGEGSTKRPLYDIVT